MERASVESRIQLQIDKQVIFIANLIVTTGILFFMTQTLDAFNFPKALIVSTGTFALTLSLVISRKYLIRIRELHWIETYILGLVISTVILASFHDISSNITIWGSFSRANGLMTRISLLLLVAIYFSFSRRETTARFFQIALLLLVVEIVYGVMQLSGRDPVNWNNPYNNIFATAGNPNFAAALYAILVVLNLRNIFQAKNVFIRSFSSVIVVVGIYMSYATQSVQGFLTIAAAVFLLGIIGIIRYISGKQLKVIMLGVATALASPIALGVFNLGPLRSFLYQETLGVRLHYWRVALRIIRDHPIAGVGIDRYGDYFRLYRESWFVDKYSPGLISTNAHNVALQWGTDLGVLGVVMYFSLLILAVSVYLKQANFNHKNSFSDLDFIFISFCAFYLQSLISIAQLSVTVLGFAILGINLSYAKEYEHESKIHKLDTKKGLKFQGNSISSFVGIGSWFSIFVFILSPFTSSFVRSDLKLRSAMQLPGVNQQVTDLELRSKAIKKGVQPFLDDQDYMSLAIQNLFIQGDAQVGLEIAKDATLSNPLSWVGFQSQVLAYSQSSMPNEALIAAQKLLDLDPLNYNVQFNLADLAFKLGNTELAVKYATLAMNAAPSTSEAFLGAQRILGQIGR